MHGVEVVALCFENRCVTKCRLLQLVFLMQSQCLLEPLRWIGLLILMWHPLEAPLSEPHLGTHGHFWQACSAAVPMFSGMPRQVPCVRQAPPK